MLEDYNSTSFLCDSHQVPPLNVKKVTCFALVFKKTWIQISAWSADRPFPDLTQ